jgi:hypothetical protein
MIYHKDDSFVARRLDEELILIPVRNKISDMNYIYILNEVGARIWELIDGLRDAKDIVRIIQEEYEPVEDLEADLLEFIADLEKIGAIRPSA